MHCEELFDIIHDVYLWTGYGRYGGRYRIEHEINKKLKNITRDMIMHT